MTNPNVRLREEREKRGWTQRFVAGKVGTNAFTVGRWERGVEMTSRHFQHSLCELFGLDAVTLGFIHDGSVVHDAVPPTSLTTLWHVPYDRNPFFTDHRQLLNLLHTRLTANEKGASCQAISGLGGIGKTQLALEYAYEYREYYTAVLWVNAEASNDIVSIGKLLQIPEIQKRKPRQQQLFDEVVEWLSTHNGWLLILDNMEGNLGTEDVEKIEIGVKIRRSLLTLKRGSLILTTRAQAITTIAQNFPLEEMQAEEGAQLLLHRSGLLVPFQAGEPDDIAKYDQALALSHLLGGLPLAIEQAAAYIEETGCSLADYRQLYEKYRKQLLQRKGKFHGIYTEYKESVATTWLISFLRVKQQLAAASDLLNLCSYLDPDSIPIDLVLQGAQALNQEHCQLTGDKLQFDDSCRVLLNYSLVKRFDEGKMLSIHRLLQAVLQDEMDDSIRRFWGEQTMRVVERGFSLSAPHMWHSDERYVRQARVCAQLIEQWDLLSEESAHLLSLVGFNLRERGLFSEAEPILHKAKKMYETLPEAHPFETFKSLLQLARFYMDAESWEHADFFQHQALALNEQFAGGTSLHQLIDLVHTFLERNELDQACGLAHNLLPYLKQEPLFAADLHSVLGGIYSYQKNAERAKYHYQQALALSKGVLGEDHPHVWAELITEAEAYLFLDDMARAEEAVHQALKGLERAFGPDHAEVAHAYELLTKIALKKKDYKQAEQLLQRSLEIKKPEDPEWTHNICALVLACLAQKKEARAEFWYQEVERQLEEIMKQHIPRKQRNEWIILLRSYAQFLIVKGRQEEANAKILRAFQLEQREKDL